MQQRPGLLSGPFACNHLETPRERAIHESPLRRLLPSPRTGKVPVAPTIGRRKDAEKRVGSDHQIAPPDHGRRPRRDEGIAPYAKAGG